MLLIRLQIHPKSQHYRKTLIGFLKNIAPLPQNRESFPWKALIYFVSKKCKDGCRLLIPFSRQG